MAVSSVSFGQNPQVVSQQNGKKSPGVVKNTVKAAALGGTVGAVAEFVKQRNILQTVKIAGTYKDFVSDMANVGKVIASSPIKKYGCERAAALFKTGTYYAKGIMKVGGVAAAVAGGVYLAYRGIKAMFS